MSSVARVSVCVCVCVIERLDSDNELCNLMNDSSPSISGKWRSDLLGFRDTTTTTTSSSSSNGGGGSSSSSSSSSNDWFHYGP
jgi:hypothetical protein